MGKNTSKILRHLIYERISSNRGKVAFELMNLKSRIQVKQCVIVKLGTNCKQK